jgi:hypothetical protein
MRQRPLSSEEVKACVETLHELRAPRREPELRIRLKAEAQVTGRISFALIR